MLTVKLEELFEVRGELSYNIGRHVTQCGASCLGPTFQMGRVVLRRVVFVQVVRNSVNICPCKQNNIMMSRRTVIVMNNTVVRARHIANY